MKSAAKCKLNNSIDEPGCNKTKQMQIVAQIIENRRICLFDNQRSNKKSVHITNLFH